MPGLLTVPTSSRLADWTCRGAAAVRPLTRLRRQNVLFRQLLPNAPWKLTGSVGVRPSNSTVPAKYDLNRVPLAAVSIEVPVCVPELGSDRILLKSRRALKLRPCPPCELLGRRRRIFNSKLPARHPFRFSLHRSLPAPRGGHESLASNRQIELGCATLVEPCGLRWTCQRIRLGPG